MFSRRGSSPAAAAGWRSILGVSSIAAHIAWLYALSAVILLSIVVALLYRVQIESMECDDIYFLIDKVQQLRLTVRRQDHPILLEHEVTAQGGVYAPGQHFIFYSRILDANGRVLMQTPGAEKNLPPSCSRR